MISTTAPACWLVLSLTSFMPMHCPTHTPSPAASCLSSLRIAWIHAMLKVFYLHLILGLNYYLFMLIMIFCYLKCYLNNHFWITFNYQIYTTLFFCPTSNFKSYSILLPSTRNGVEISSCYVFFTTTTSYFFKEKYSCKHNYALICVPI